MKDKTDARLARILWDYNNIEDKLEKVDIILGLGNSDVKTAVHAGKLYLSGYAPLILFTGQYGLLTKNNFEKTEAEIFAYEALKLGVPKEKILLEDKATNTGENIQFTRELLLEKNIKANNFIVVTKPHQLRRAYATFEKVWPGNKLIMSSVEVNYEEYIKDLNEENFINSLVAATQRIIIYPEKGFQIAQEMPDEVHDAYEELIRRGYTKQLIS